nr:unnamed protein product [Digitaria exilis]
MMQRAEGEDQKAKGGVPLAWALPRGRTPALTRRPPRLTARPAPGDVTARAARAVVSNCARTPRLKRRAHFSHETTKFSLVGAFKAPTLEGKASKLEGSRKPLRGTEVSKASLPRVEQRSRLPPRSEEAIVLLIRGSNLGPSEGFNKGPRSTESGIIDGTLEARTLEETNRLCSRPGKHRALDLYRMRSSPPTLIERGMDVCSNHPLSAQQASMARSRRGKHGSPPPQTPRTRSMRRDQGPQAKWTNPHLRKQRMLFTSSLGGYTRGCASAPPRILRTREGTKASKASTSTNLRRIESHSRGGSGATAGPAKAHHRDNSSALIQLEVDDHLRAGISVSEISTLERAFPSQRARACGPSSGRPRREQRPRLCDPSIQIMMTLLCGQKVGDHCATPPSTPRKRHRPNLGSSTVPTTPLTSLASGTPPSSKATLEGSYGGSIWTPYATVTRRKDITSATAMSSAGVGKRDSRSHSARHGRTELISFSHLACNPLPRATRNRCSAPLLDDKSPVSSLAIRETSGLAPQSLVVLAQQHDIFFLFRGRRQNDKNISPMWPCLERDDVAARKEKGRLVL